MHNTYLVFVPYFDCAFVSFTFLVHGELWGKKWLISMHASLLLLSRYICVQMLREMSLQTPRMRDLLHVVIPNSLLFLGRLSHRNANFPFLTPFNIRKTATFLRCERLLAADCETANHIRWIRCA